MTPRTWDSEIGRTMMAVKGSVIARLERCIGEPHSTQPSVTTLYASVRVDASHYMFSMHRVHNIKSEP